MSIDTNLNLLDRFKNINILIKELEDDSNNNEFIPKIITIGNLSEKFGYSQLEWSYILNEYVLQTKNVYEKLVILFLIEINENDNLTKILILPSFSNKLEQIIKDKKTINCTAYAFTLYNQNLTTLDYGAIIDEIPIIQKYKIENENKSNKKEKKERKINIYDEKAEENYYGNYEPKEENKDNNKNKRKNKKNSDKNLTKTSNNKAYIVLDDEPQNNQSNKDNIIKNETKEENHNDQPKERKKVIKTRKVKQTNTFMDKDGYMVTKDQLVDEEYETYEDEIEKKPVFHPQIQPNQPQKKNKKVQKGQTSLFNYFSK